MSVLVTLQMTAMRMQGVTMKRKGHTDVHAIVDTWEMAETVKVY